MRRSPPKCPSPVSSPLFHLTESQQIDSLSHLTALRSSQLLQLQNELQLLTACPAPLSTRVSELEKQWEDHEERM